MLTIDSVMFPKSFFIKIYTRNKGKLLKELNAASFLQHAEPQDWDMKNPLTAQQWTLTIDSTLLDLKKYGPCPKKVAELNWVPN
jgi:hypothetical protein